MTLIQTADAYTFSFMYPFAVFMVSEFDVEPVNVGLFTGMLSCAFPLGVAIGGFFWGMFVDRVGSKLVVVISLIASIFCTLYLGLAPNYWTAFTIKLLSGIFNGIETVLKSYVGRITTGSNQAAGFSAIILAWGFGTILSPYASGFLSKPSLRYPHTFSHRFWHEYQYFLPCLASATLSFIALAVALLFMDEIGPAREKPDSDGSYQELHVKIEDEVEEDEKEGIDEISRSALLGDNEETFETSKTNLLPSSPSLIESQEQDHRGRPDFKKNMYISAFLYSWIVYCILVLDETVPLFAKSDISKGGLGYTIPLIGVVVSIDGMANVIGVLLFIPYVMKRFGTTYCFRIATAVLVPTIALYPAMNLVARMSGDSNNIYTWAVVSSLQFIKGLCASIMFTAGMVFLSNSVPTSYKGKANGISTSISSFLRVMGPCYAGSLWSLIQYDFQGLVYCEWIPFFIYSLHIFLALVWGFLIDPSLKTPYEEVYV